MKSNIGTFQITCTPGDHYDTISGRDIDYTKLVFSGGEVQIAILNKSFQPYVKNIEIEAHLTSSESIMELVLLVDALRREYRTTKISLVCPYLPYARQDRVMNQGESLGVKVMCDIINSLGFESVTIWDCHSDVGSALLNNVTNLSALQFVLRIGADASNTILVAPDAGAMKKVGAIAKYKGYEMISAEKKRNTQTGEIAGTKVHFEGTTDKNFLIVDDICDGGRTFTELGAELKKLTAGKVWLYVTHGIFSKGLDVFDGVVDHVYTAKAFPGVDTSHRLLTVLS